MRTAYLIAAFVLMVAACGTKQEQCIRTATREIRTLDHLTAEAEANLARGYAYEEREIVRHVWQRCDNGLFDPGHPRRMCFEPVFDTVRRPVAIDPAAETRKLDGLKARRAALVGPVSARIESCRVTYPES
ncbi:hypothetical protein DEA8626_03895 [Defluviimonas aquaemixtae]|uniref:Uncharacterized protein n=1 Tax=Albidovulum aquaemixtae TaxID=1542388 RepID=A0A2R8BN47_9RHOB|nr:hypothetical protein [Defluviimonas aquaemixtae]SPH24861.1 hypothetical protein DEA8626_03895 [Defluviimonas aquaemixtae]